MPLSPLLPDVGKTDDEKKNKVDRYNVDDKGFHWHLDRFSIKEVLNNLIILCQADYSGLSAPVSCRGSNRSMGMAARRRGRA